MSAVHLEKVQMLHLLWTIPVLAAMALYAYHRRRRALGAIASAGLLKHINTSVSSARRWWKAAIVMLAAAAVVVALVRPGWNPKPKTIQRRGRDVVFVLDVSRSMMAEDLAPNRLDRAKLAVTDCIETLQGDRVGLVAFAGTAAVKCPLTLDYGFFRLMLEDVVTGSIARGGTMIGDAIRKVVDEMFDDREKKFKDIILITDGEDHDSFPLEAAEQAGARGVRIIAIGLGDENQGKRIPITDEHGNKTFLKYNGQEIWSVLDAKSLRAMAAATPGGKYLNVATGAIDLGNVYQELVASAEKKDLESRTIKHYEEKFQIFIAVAFAALALEMLIAERKKRP